MITHNEYVDAVDKDRDYAIKQRDLWEAKLEEAQRELEKWEKQVNCLTAIYARTSLSNQSAFSLENSNGGTTAKKNA